MVPFLFSLEMSIFNYAVALKDYPEYQKRLDSGLLQNVGSVGDFRDS